MPANSHDAGGPQLRHRGLAPARRAARRDGTLGEPSPNVDECITRILDLCDETNVKATFFVLGVLAASRLHLVKLIAARP